MTKTTVPPAYLPATWELSDVVAVQALAAGTASADQQVRALNWVVYRACATDEVEYRPDEREHVLASGRRFVGLQIRKLMAINIGAINKRSEN